MLTRFRRILSNGNYIPEIDGIRFWAISWVALYHMMGFYSVKKEMLTGPFATFSHLGFQGVELFFVLSGYVLTYPFAKAYTTGTQPTTLRNYFMRRLTRLEPPYILAVLISFVSLVYVLHKATASDMLPYLASALTYTTALIHGDNKLNTVLWSLEVEVQFYILAPFICMLLFRTIKNNRLRLLILLASIILFAKLHEYAPLPFKSLYGFFHFFLAGILLSLISVRRVPDFNSLFVNIISIVLIGTISVCDYTNGGLYSAFAPLLIASLFYLIIKHKGLNFIFANPVLCIIGGACYSIYLLHYLLISLLGNIIIDKVQLWLFVPVVTIFILLVSAVFYLLIERPCMDKNWPKKMINVLRRKAYNPA